MKTEIQMIMDDSADALLRVVPTPETGPVECRLYWKSTPWVDGWSSGAIGYFEPHSVEAGREILEQACDILREKGCVIALGPMEGDTWHRYRLVTGPGERPPFFLEPYNPPDLPGLWQDAGFAPLARYISSSSGEIPPPDSRIARTRERLAGLGITIRPLRKELFEEDLRGIFDLSLQAFRQNYLFTPICWEDFLELYRPVLPVLDERFTRVALVEGETVGFLFAIPDLHQQPQPHTLIVKTLAVKPGRAWAGLGALLLEEIHREAERAGFTGIIHALMHSAIKSANLSSRTTKVFREYTLFGREL